MSHVTAALVVWAPEGALLPLGLVEVALSGRGRRLLPCVCPGAWTGGSRCGHSFHSKDRRRLAGLRDPVCPAPRPGGLCSGLRCEPGLTEDCCRAGRPRGGGLPGPGLQVGRWGPWVGLGPAWASPTGEMTCLFSKSVGRVQTVSNSRALRLSDHLDLLFLLVYADLRPLSLRP